MTISHARRPRGFVLLNGVETPWLEFDVDANAFAEADKARVSLPVSALPPEANLDWIAGQPTIEIEIRAGLIGEDEKATPAQLASLFVGRVDTIEFSPVAGTVDLGARDLTSLLIDERTSERYTNLTASRLVEQLAAKHGLNPVVTQTQTRIGSFYQVDQVRVQSRRTEWDLLSWVAREEDFVVYVNGRDLVFAPRPDPSQEPYIVEWRAPKEGGPPGADFTRVSLSKTLNLARDIRVTVRSWNHRQGVRITKTAGSGADSDPKFEYSIPGLTADQAQARADQIFRELTQHAMRLSIDGPADDALSLADVIQLKGCGPFDQIYYPESIRRSMSAREGYRWSVEAKNQSRDKSG